MSFGNAMRHGRPLLHPQPPHTAVAAASEPGDISIVFEMDGTFKHLTTSFSLAESDSPKSLQPEPSYKTLLFDLPPDYFAKLPNDLRLDLNDAAFDLSNVKIIDECGQELGETLLNLSRAWEVADKST